MGTELGTEVGMELGTELGGQSGAEVGTEVKMGKGRHQNVVRQRAVVLVDL